jgi:hypothetical protein
MGGMRGVDSKQSSMFCLMSPKSRVPQDHPLRTIKKMCEAVLTDLSPTFDAMYRSTSSSAPASNPATDSASVVVRWRGRPPALPLCSGSHATLAKLRLVAYFSPAHAG